MNLLANGIVLALYGAEGYERQLGPIADGFRGFSLCINCKDWEEVESIHAEVIAFDDVRDIDEPSMGSYGGGGFGFRDPEGNIWEVIWVEGGRFDERDGLTFP